jgi:hypothetical protein
MKPKPKEKAPSRIEQFGLIDWRWLLWNGRRLAGCCGRATALFGVY